MAETLTLTAELVFEFSIENPHDEYETADLVEIFPIGTVLVWLPAAHAFTVADFDYLIPADAVADALDNDDDALARLDQIAA